MSGVFPQVCRVFVNVSDYPKAAGEIPFDVRVEWGDGLVTEYTGLQVQVLNQITHDYMAPGRYVIRIIVTNSCGSVTKILPVTVSVVGNHPSAILVQSYALDITDVQVDERFEHNVPVLDVSGNVVVSQVVDVNEPLLPQYKFDVVLNVAADSSLEMIRYPVTYELVPKQDNLTLSVPSNTAMALDDILHILSEEPPRAYASIAADRVTRIVFDYINRLTTPDYSVFYDAHVTHDVTVYGNKALVDRIVAGSNVGTGVSWSEPVMLDVSDAEGLALLTERGWILNGAIHPDIPFDIWKITIDFGGVTLPGFALHIDNGDGVGYWLDTDINILYPEGDIKHISHNWIDVYQDQFLRPETALLEDTMQSEVTVTGGVIGEIQMKCSERIDKVEIDVTTGGLERITYDDAKAMTGDRYMLTILNGNGAQDNHACVVYINDGANDFVISRFEIFKAVQPQQEDMAVVLNSSGTTTQCAGNYYMSSSTVNETPVYDTLISVHSASMFDESNPALNGEFNIMTNFGNVTGNFVNAVS